MNRSFETITREEGEREGGGEKDNSENAGWGTIDSP